MTSRATVFSNFVRHISFFKKRVKWKDEKGNPESVKYGPITYFPRNQDRIDPPFEPSKLLLVRRVKAVSGNTKWDKLVLQNLGLAGRTDEPIIFKNIPAICGMLWKVKHLIKITPIQLPSKLPTADDLNGTYLHENGMFYVIPKIDPARIEATEKFIKNPKKLNRDIISEKLRLKWLEGRPLEY